MKSRIVSRKVLPSDDILESVEHLSELTRRAGRAWIKQRLQFLLLLKSRPKIAVISASWIAGQHTNEWGYAVIRQYLRGGIEEVCEYKRAPSRRQRQPAALRATTPAGHTLISAVCQAYGLPVHRIAERTKEREVTVPRQVAIYLLRIQMGYSWGQLADTFDIKKSPVRRAFRYVEGQLVNKEFARQVERIADWVQSLPAISQDGKEQRDAT